MAPPLEHASALPADRAFVVHFTGGRSGRRRFRGRVEHLSSGHSAQFSSLRTLLAFFARPQEDLRPPRSREQAERDAGDLRVDQP